MKRKMKIEIEIPVGSSKSQLFGQFQTFLNFSRKIMEGGYRGNSLSIHFWRKRFNRRERRNFLIFLTSFQETIEKNLSESVVIKEEFLLEDINPKIHGSYLEIINQFRISKPAIVSHQSGINGNQISQNVRERN